MWELAATNQSGKSMTLNVFKRPHEGGWGIACTPECDKIDPIMSGQPRIEQIACTGRDNWPIDPARIIRESVSIELVEM